MRECVVRLSEALVSHSENSLHKRAKFVSKTENPRRSPTFLDVYVIVVISFRHFARISITMLSHCDRSGRGDARLTVKIRTEIDEFIPEALRILYNPM